MKLASGTFAKHAADTDSMLDYVRALNPFAVAMEAPSGQRMSRQLGGWAQGIGGGALGGLLGGLGGQELGGLAGSVMPEAVVRPGVAMLDLGGQLAHGTGLVPEFKALMRRALKSPSSAGHAWDLGARGIAGLAIGSTAGALGGASAGAALGGLRGHVGALRGARAARLEQEAAERTLREVAERAALGGGNMLSELAERAMSAARRNPLMAGAGLGLAGAAALG